MLQAPAFTGARFRAARRRFFSSWPQEGYGVPRHSAWVHTTPITEPGIFRYLEVQMTAKRNIQQATAAKPARPRDFGCTDPFILNRRRLALQTSHAWKLSLHDTFSDPSHQAKIKRQVVNGVQGLRQQLLRGVKMAKISP
jgi:hypothetical protein